MIHKNVQIRINIFFVLQKNLQKGRQRYEPASLLQKSVVCLSHKSDCDGAISPIFFLLTST